jgi:Fic family protein
MAQATRRFAPGQPYNDLPLLPPDADIETRDILRACIEARAGVAELKQAGHLLPNQAILINILPILEARASSAVENIVTTADRLFQYAQDETQPADAATREALRYRTALRRGFESLAHRPLTTATAVEVCRTLRGIDTDVRAVPGTALTNAATGTMVYTPPDGQDRLRRLLANWERYLHDNTTVDAMIRMAVGHYQFEAIHPFTDGNGRTGRILNLLYLVDQKLLDQPVLYLSRAIIRNQIDYYRLLHAVTSDAAWQPWVRYMLEAVAETARWTTAKIHAIRDLLRDTMTFVQRRAPAVYTRELVELIFAQPYCRIANVVDAGIARRQTASEYLKQLRDIGVLDEVKVGREKLFIHPKLMSLLTSEGHIVPQYES